MSRGASDRALLLTLLLLRCPAPRDSAPGWEPMMLECIFFPDPLQRAFQAMSEDREPTGWSMGAIGSAILFVEG